MDMVRDIGSRLLQFGAMAEVERIALTMEQIRQYDPPPNPAKLSDPRSEMYVAEYGNNSWELDALNPDVLAELVDSSITKHMDMSLYEEMVLEEEEEKSKLDRAVRDMESLDAE